MEEMIKKPKCLDANLEEAAIKKCIQVSTHTKLKKPTLTYDIYVQEIQLPVTRETVMLA